jgi:hypothetical protein
VISKTATAEIKPKRKKHFRLSAKRFGSPKTQSELPRCCCGIYRNVDMLLLYINVNIIRKRNDIVIGLYIYYKDSDSSLDAENQLQRRRINCCQM